MSIQCDIETTGQIRYCSNMRQKSRILALQGTVSFPALRCVLEYSLGVEQLHLKFTALF
jgi:hypothetical protein